MLFTPSQVSVELKTVYLILGVRVIGQDNPFLKRTTVYRRDHAVYLTLLAILSGLNLRPGPVFRHVGRTSGFYGGKIAVECQEPVKGRPAAVDREKTDEILPASSL